MRAIKTAWYWFIRAVVRYGFFLLSGGFTVVGKSNVPLKGGLLIAPNHASYLDPPAMGCALPRTLTFMAKEELFRNRFVSWLIRSLGAFPVRRGASDMESIRNALSILERGDAMLMFPEGTRGDGETLLPLNRGVEALARKSGCYVMPVAIIGTSQKWGKLSKKLFGKRVTIAFGEPILYADFSEKGAFGAELEKRIVTLCHDNGYPIKISADNPPSKTTDSDGVANAVELRQPVETPAHPEI